MASRSVSNIVCSVHFTLCVNNDKNVVSFGKSDKGAHGHKESVVFPPKIISSLKNIISISVGGYHCVCLDHDGNVFTFGSNNRGQLGIDVDYSAVHATHVPHKVHLPPCKQVCSANLTTMCLTETGEVYSFGSNWRGLGEREMPKNEITKHPTLSNIMDSSTGGLQTFVKTFENEIYAFGKNSHSQLGIKTTFLKRTTPIRVFEG